MRIKILSETIRAQTISITDPETGEPTGKTKEVLSFIVAFGADRKSFTFDMPLKKPKIVSEIKASATEILANRKKAENIRKWLKNHDLYDVDTDEL